MHVCSTFCQYLKLNNYNSKYSCQYNIKVFMKNQPKHPSEQKNHKIRGIDYFDNPINTKPIKSPSPDKRSANIIVNTRSPGLQQIKKQITPIKQEPTALKILQKIEQRQKIVSSGTPKNNKDAYINEQKYMYFQAPTEHANNDNEQFHTYIKQENKSKYQTESRTHHKAQRSQDLPSQFQTRMSSRYKENYQSKTGQLDYLRLLKQKQQTIKELRDILELIDKSNSGQFEENQKIKLLERKLKEYSKQVKVLEIENQCLISVIQNNHVNLPSNKEEILQREIRELRQSLSLLQQESSQELDAARKRSIALEMDNKELQNQCNKLLKLMKERDHFDRKQSGNSSHPLLSKDKERVTLSKIKEQYNQNLRLAQQNFENQYRDCYENFKKIIQKQSNRLDYYNIRIHELELALKDTKQKTKPKTVQNIQHQEIQSLLLEKYSKYMKELDEEKKVNEKLNLQLSIAWKSLRELEIKSFNSSQDVFNQSHSEEISELSNRNSSLKAKIKQLESLNQTLKKSLQQLSALKSREIYQLQQKIQTLIDVYEQKLKNDKEVFTQKCKQLQFLNKQAKERQNRSKEQQSEKQKVIEQKITAIIQTFEKQADIYRDTLQQRAKIIENLQQQNQFLRGQLQMCMNMKQKETDISKLSENQKLVQSLESELKYIKTRLQQSEERTHGIQEDKKYLEYSNDNLKKEISDTVESFQIKIQLIIKQNKTSIQQLSHKLQEKQSVSRQNQKLRYDLHEVNQSVWKLKQQIAALQTENRESHRFIEELKGLNIRVNDSNFQQQLKSLKKSILDFLEKYKQQYSGKNLENYYTIQALYQEKIDENVKLHHQIEELKDSLSRSERQKTRLFEKIANLQKNVVIYEQELKERRLLYQTLLKEKSRIEKEIILSRKIKETQANGDQQINGNVNQITNQIDKLVQLQKQRSNSISQYFVLGK